MSLYSIPSLSTFNVMGRSHGVLYTSTFNGAFGGFLHKVMINEDFFSKKRLDDEAKG